MTVTAAVGRPARSESPAASWCLAAGDIPWEYAPAAQARSIAQRPEWIAAFLEMKTVWHPVGV